MIISTECCVPGCDGGRAHAVPPQTPEGLCEQHFLLASVRSRSLLQSAARRLARLRRSWDDDTNRCTKFGWSARDLPQSAATAAGSPPSPARNDGPLVDSPRAQGRGLGRSNLDCDPIPDALKFRMS